MLDTLADGCKNCGCNLIFLCIGVLIFEYVIASIIAAVIFRLIPSVGSDASGALGIAIALIGTGIIAVIAIMGNKK
jgi:hypothetical protein